MTQTLWNILLQCVALIALSNVTVAAEGLTLSDEAIHSRVADLVGAAYRNVDGTNKQRADVKAAEEELRGILPDDLADLPNQLIDSQASLADLRSAWGELIDQFSKPGEWFFHVELTHRMPKRDDAQIAKEPVVSVLLCLVSESFEQQAVVADQPINFKTIVTDSRKIRSYEEFRAV